MSQCLAYVFVNCMILINNGLKRSDCTTIKCFYYPDTCLFYIGGEIYMAKNIERTRMIYRFIIYRCRKRNKFQQY